MPEVFLVNWTNYHVTTAPTLYCRTGLSLLIMFLTPKLLVLNVTLLDKIVINMEICQDISIISLPSISSLQHLILSVKLPIPTIFLFFFLHFTIHLHLASFAILPLHFSLTFPQWVFLPSLPLVRFTHIWPFSPHYHTVYHPTHYSHKHISSIIDHVYIPFTLATIKSLLL